MSSACCQEQNAAGERMNPLFIFLLVGLRGVNIINTDSEDTGIIL